jgi:nicotinamidase-related amidase
MMLAKLDKSVLLLVDLQQKLMPAISHGDEVIAQCVRLATVAKLLGVPVIGTEQSPEGLGPNVPAIREVCGKTVVKTHFDACANGLQAQLPPACKSLVVAGCEAHVCMMQTALGLIGLRYEVWIAIDAVGSRRDSDRDAALHRLEKAGANLATVEMLAFEWMRDSDHPQFREVLKAIK